MFAFAPERFVRLCEITTGYDAHWIFLVTKIAIYGCLHYSQRVGLEVGTIVTGGFAVCTISVTGDFSD